MLKRMLNSLKNNENIRRGQKGITGLETAIILIAFVVVAAVLAYTILSSGLFSTQKSKEAVYSALEQAQSTLVLKSFVYAKAAPAPNSTDIGQLTFSVALGMGGGAIDMTNPTNSSGLATGNNRLMISYIDKYQKVDNLAWTSTVLGTNNGDNNLNQGEEYQITIGGTTNTDNLYAVLTSRPLTTDTDFTIEIKTNQGAVLSFSRVTPSYLDNNNNLH